MHYYPEQQLLDIYKDILENGEERMDRTGVGTISVFGRQMRFDLTKGFPAITTKKLAFESVLSEDLFFLEGSSDERRLAEILHGTRDHAKKTIWHGNANADYWTPKAKFPGDLGRVYGVQWRDWKSYKIEGVGGTLGYPDSVEHEDGSITYFNAKVKVTKHDQVKNLIHTLKTNPNDRRMILTAMNIGEFDQMALPPCHMFAQFYVNKISRERRCELWRNYMIQETGRAWFIPDEDIISSEEFDKVMDEKGIPTSKLSCQVYMRSNDLFLGAPFNIAGYALITHMIAQVVDMDVGELIMTIGDAHIYKNHVDQVKEQLTRTPYELPQLWMNPYIKNIDEFKMNDFQLVDYQHHPSIKGAMAV